MSAPVPQRRNEETWARWRRKTTVMAALYELHRDYPVSPGFTMYDIVRKSGEMGHPIKPSTYLMRLIRELYHEGEVKGAQGVSQRNKDGTEVVAYYWYLPGYTPYRQQPLPGIE